MFKKGALNGNNYTYIVRQKGGHLSQSDGFWGQLGKVNDDDDIEKLMNNSSTDSENQSENEQPIVLHCPDQECIAVYLTQKGMENHSIVDIHRVPKKKDSVTDRGSIVLL